MSIQAERIDTISGDIQIDADLMPTAAGDGLQSDPELFTPVGAIGKLKVDVSQIGLLGVRCLQGHAPCHALRKAIYHSIKGTLRVAKNTGQVLPIEREVEPPPGDGQIHTGEKDGLRPDWNDLPVSILRGTAGLAPYIDEANIISQEHRFGVRFVVPHDENRLVTFLKNTIVTSPWHF